MVLDALVTSFMSQLHEGSLGLFIKATDIDTGSHSGALVCNGSELCGSISKIHPEITFTEPMQNVHVHATSAGGKTMWDADYNLGGKTVLAKTAQGAGAVPYWNKVCTPAEGMEQYNIAITGISVKGTPITTSVSFTSDNSGGLATPARTLPVRVALPGADPLLPPVVPIGSQDMDPRRYLSQKLF